MRTIQKIPWPRVLGEGVIIVVSILLAFWIQAWWDDRQESIEEQSLLRQLKSEFEENAVLLADKRAGHEAARVAGLRLLSVMGPDAEVEELGIESARNALITILLLRTFDPGTGALSTVISSGKLDLISSEELRTDLASWPARYQDISEDEQWLVAMSQDRLGPYFSEFATMRNMTVALKDIRPSLFPEDIETMLRDRKFENIVVSKTGITTTLIEYYDEMKLQFDKTLALIESQIF